MSAIAATLAADGLRNSPERVFNTHTCVVGHPLAVIACANARSDHSRGEDGVCGTDAMRRFRFAASLSSCSTRHHGNCSYHVYQDFKVIKTESPGTEARRAIRWQGTLDRRVKVQTGGRDQWPRR